MLAKRFRLTDNDITDTQRKNFEKLREMLVEKGYSAFLPHQNWRHHPELDMLLVKHTDMQVSSKPVLAYPGRNGSIMLRAWAGRIQKIYIRDIRTALPLKLRRKMKLRQARRPLQGDWKDYFALEELEAAKPLDLGV